MDFLKLLGPLRNRIANMIARATVQRVDDSTKMQLVQLAILDGEVREDVEHVQQYGFTSVPQEGAEAVVVFVGGNRDHGLVVATDDRRYRVKGLQAGEVAIYTDQGDSVVIKRGGTIEITGATKVKLAAPAVELAGASEHAIKGDAYVSAESTFLTALNTYAVAIKTIADPTNAATPVLTAAITAFKTAADAAKSTKVTLG